MVKAIKIILMMISFSVLASNDPTRPLLGISKQIKKINKKSSTKQPLTAIFHKGNQYFAIIENKKYRVGEVYRGSKVTKITSDKVFLNSLKGKHQLTLFQKIKK